MVNYPSPGSPRDQAKVDLLHSVVGHVAGWLQLDSEVGAETVPDLPGACRPLFELELIEPLPVRDIHNKGHFPLKLLLSQQENSVPRDELRN